MPRLKGSAVRLFALLAFAIGLFAGATVSAVAHEASRPDPNCWDTLAHVTERRDELGPKAPYVVLSIAEARLYSDQVSVETGSPPADISTGLFVWANLQNPGSWVVARIFAREGYDVPWVCGPYPQIPADVHRAALRAARSS